MSLVEERTDMLIQAMGESDLYQHYLKVKKEVEQNEVLCQKIDEYRQKNFQLHISLEGEELYNAMENFERENIAFRKDPLVNQFLAAELAVVRMVQQIEKKILDAVDLELKFAPSSYEDE
jgi:cell fate (sporulation/competence/biofilm development) regulator YlbF (YheA/YmcA/DUF963 family)